MKDVWRHFAAEFIGVFALVFIGGGAILTTPLINMQAIVMNVAFAHGLILALLVTATMRISGHLNPAVTAGFLVTRRIEPMMAVVYWIAQFLAAVIAAYALKLLYPSTLGAQMALGAQRLSNDVTMTQGIILEAIGTFLLTFVVWGTAVDPRAPKVGGFAIGLTVTANIIAIGPLTGGSFNPARSFGPAVASGSFTGQIVYWVGPILGACVAALLYDKVFMPREIEPADHGAVRPVA